MEAFLETELRKGFLDRARTLAAETLRDIPPIVLAASVAINLLSLVLPLAIMQVYDRLIPRKAVETLTVLLLALAGIVIMEAVLRITRSYMITWPATRLAWRVQDEALARMFAAPLTHLDREAPINRLNRLQSLLTVAEWQGSPSRLVLIDLPFIVIFLAIMATVGGWLILAPVFLCALLGFAAALRARNMRASNEKRSIEDMKIRDFLVETLTGISTIKALSMEQQMVRRFERLQETAVGCTYDTIRLSDEAQSFANLLSNLTQIMTVTAGAMLAINGYMTVGAVACCTTLAGRATQPFLRCASAWNEIQGLLVAKDKAAPLMALSPAPAELTMDIPIESGLGIQFQAVSFNYEDPSRPLLKAISLAVEPGELIAISGADGSGKSTLIGLLTGEIAPLSGAVTIGGLDVVAERALIKQKVALVSSSCPPVRGSIIDNIAMFRKGIAIDNARAASRLIGLESEIHRLPNGYETRIADGVAADLPAAMLQGIAIARALARRPALLILDEANASFDIRADRLLMEGLNKLRLHMTIVIVTNRPSFVAIADRQFVLADGVLRQAPAIAGEFASEGAA